MEELTNRCPNCGTEWPSVATPGSAFARQPAICPVCLYQIDAPSLPPDVAPLSDTTFAHQLSLLITQARTAGVSDEQINCSLRDGLAFAAELRSPGHRVFIQVIDLGPDENGAFPAATRVARQVSQRHAP